jgi:hypothetical protein
MFCLLCGAFTYIGANYEGPLRLLEPYRTPTYDEAVALCPVDYAFSTTQKNDVILIGDSTCRCGIDTRQFEKVTSFSTYNLGSFASGGVFSQLLTLQVYLRQHPPPRAVVLCLSRFQLLRERGSDSAAAAPSVGVTTAGALFERFERAFGPPSARKSVLADGTASVRYFIKRGTAVTNSLWVAFRSGHTSDRLDDRLFGYTSETYKTLRSKTVGARGFFGLKEKHGPHMELTELDKPYSVVPWMNEGVRAFARLAQSCPFRLIIRLAPMSSDQSAWGGDEHLARWLKQIEGEFPEVSICRPEMLWYNPELCWDAIHLNKDGVERFTRVVAKEVTEFLGPRPRKAFRSK